MITPSEVTKHITERINSEFSKIEKYIDDSLLSGYFEIKVKNTSEVIVDLAVTKYREKGWRVSSRPLIDSNFRGEEYQDGFILTFAEPWGVNNG